MNAAEEVHKAKRIAILLLPETGQVAEAEVVKAVDTALDAIPAARPMREELIREIEATCNVYVPEATALEGAEDHLEWLSARRGQIKWRFWRRYRDYLAETKEWPPNAIARLDDVTDGILGRLEEPARPSSWDRRGMVVGHVQSGKTANYTGLICKAADAGYKLIVVLAGVHDSLRSQTQLRLDEGFLGYDTQRRMLFDQKNTRLGAGLLKGAEFFHVNSLTSSAQNGDFKKGVAEGASIPVGGSDPLLLVVKKNKKILNNLIAWLTPAQQQLARGSTKLRVPNVPMLVVDDECDQASVNTRDTFDEVGVFDPEADPTVINGCIRRLLDSFEQSAYVGYTATPFANIFIYRDTQTGKHGEDLFPRSFIVNLKKPSDYIGPARVFGVQPDESSGVEAAQPLPITRTVKDAEPWIPTTHKNGYLLPADSMPQSLREALLSFVLTCAARIARGQANEHNSMLVHVTRFTNVQQQVADQVGSELRYIKDRIELGDGGKPSTLIDELKRLWEGDFRKTMRALGDTFVPQLSWQDVEPNLHAASSKIEVRVINGKALDALEYFGKPQGVSVVAIGGDKLSRGLTLEGLSVSYYLRTSRMYDTLLQMGRWFGYRPGYADLCRLFTTAELQRWYKNITLASEELLGQFDEMALVGGTPLDFGLKVRNSPDGLMITAAAKLRNGTKMRLSFSGSISETIVFHRSDSIVNSNYACLEALIRANLSRSQPERDRNDNLLWRDVEGIAVAEFLDTFRTHESATKAQAKILASYIRSRLAASPSELTTWTVAILSNPGPPAKIADLKVGCTERTKFPGDAPLDQSYAIRRLVSPADEMLDLDQAARERALAETIEQATTRPATAKRPDPGLPKIPNGPSIRRQRPPERGLLLIYLLDPLNADLPEGSRPLVGLALSFPKSPSAASIEYTINNTYWDQEIALE